MNIQEILDLIARRDAGINLYFTRKTSKGYFTYSPEVHSLVLEEIINYAISYLNNFVDYEQVVFNPTGYRSGTIELCNTDYVGNYEEVIESFNLGNVENIEDQADNFSFYCIEIKSNHKIVRLFRRVTKFKRLYTKGLLAVFQGKQLNKINNKILGLDGNIDIIAYGEEIAVLSHVALERIFKVQEQYYIKANEAIDQIRKANGIINFDAFEEDCLTDLKIQKILTKMLKEGNDLENCFENFDNIIETINIFDLDIEIQSVPLQAIVYESKSQMMDILRLIRDSFYRSIIKGNPGIDDKM